MSGHSKWAQIKRKKGAADVRRGKLFSQLTKAVTVAARTGQNLEMAVARAKAANMSADTIERAIKKGTGELNDGTQIEALTYEAYGPGGAGLLITVLTDNRNRTLAELKSTFNKLGGHLAESGSVQYQFERKGIVDIKAPAPSQMNAAELALIEAGAQEITAEDDRLIVLTDPADVAAVRSAAATMQIEIYDTNNTNVPRITISLAPADREKLLRLMEAVDGLDDVESVETNAELA